MPPLSNCYHYKSFWLRSLAFGFDLFGSAMARLVRIFVKPPPLQDVKKILVIRLDHIGDVVMTRPAIRTLHKKFPNAEIDLLVDEGVAPLFESAKEIHQVMRAQSTWFSRNSNFSQQWRAFWRLARHLAKFGYDLAIDFRGDVRNILLMVLAHIPRRLGFGVTGGGFLLTEPCVYDRTIHQVLLNLKILSPFHVPQDNKLLPFEYSSEKSREFWERIGELPTTALPRVAIHMGSAMTAKRWDTDSFRALIQKLDRENLAQILLLGTESDRENLPDLKLDTANLLDLRGRTLLEDLPVLFDVCDVFVGSDSGPAHIAAAQGLEVVLLASGTNDIRLWYPWTERLHILQHEVPCSPCCQPVCPVEGHPCMEMITVEQVFDAVLSVLRRISQT